MSFHQNTGQERYRGYPTDSYCLKPQQSDQLSSIQQFFDERVFEKKLQTQQSSQEKCDNLGAQTLRKESDDTGNHETQAHCHQKSMFHNFQKHLISLLRKVISMSFESAGLNSNEYLATLLWNTFKKVPSYNKQTLHMILGVSNFNNFEAQLQKIASKYKQFRPLWNRYSADQIFEAQTFIRNQVVQQISKINKVGLRACSNVRKFQTFYEYLQSFLLQLREGSISSRMSKTRKLLVLQKMLRKGQNK